MEGGKKRMRGKKTGCENRFVLFLQRLFVVVRLSKLIAIGLVLDKTKTGLYQKPTRAQPITFIGVGNELGSVALAACRSMPNPNLMHLSNGSDTSNLYSMGV